MNQKQFLDVIDCDLAVSRFQDALLLQPLGSEAVELDQALSRILSADVLAPINVPGFDRSNFDGYAVRAADTAGADELNPRRLQLLNERIATARVPQSRLKQGQALAIATGAMLPRGADAIVLVEQASEELCGSSVLINRSVTPGFGISFAGSDIATGQIVLRQGDLLTSRETGVLSAIGLTQVSVWRKPKVAIISTGDEIIPPGKQLAPALIYDSNTRILADAVRELGCLPLEMGIAVDEMNRLRALVKKALELADVVLLSGGTSKGDGDLSYQVVAEYHDPGIVAHGVALKPGKPICLAVTQGKPLVVLPGFPTSAIFTFHEFIAPVLKIFAGSKSVRPATCAAELATKINSDPGRTEFLLVSLFHKPCGQTALPTAYPLGQGSGSVTTFSQADGFIKIERHTEMLSAGSRVEVQLIGVDAPIADLTVIGSHCLGLDLLLSKMQSRGFRTKFFAVGSSAGLQAAKRGDCDIAGIHLYDPESQTYNSAFIDESVMLVKGYQRMQSLVCRADEKRCELHSAPGQLVRELAQQSDCQMVNRNQGSGTRILIDRLLEDLRPAGYTNQATNHHAVAAAIAQGRADWGIAIETAARDRGLKVIALEAEDYDFVIPRERYELPAVVAFRELLAEPQTRIELAQRGCHFEYAEN
jgi:putative molybdopterin biosynthesis protein